MINLSDALTRIVDTLQKAGLPAVRHAREIHQFPALVVYPDTVTFDRLDGQSYTYQVQLALLAADTGYGDDALKALSQMMQTLREKFGVKEFKAEDLGLENMGADPFPAFSASIKFNIQDLGDEDV